MPSAWCWGAGLPAGSGLGSGGEREAEGMGGVWEAVAASCPGLSGRPPAQEDTFGFCPRAEGDRERTGLLS